MPKQNNQHLFFVAILIPEPLKEEIQELRLLVKKKYESRQALKSPPHITLLAPFKSEPEQEKKMEEILADLSSRFNTFNAELQDISSFSTRVIYIKVTENPYLTEMQKTIEKEARNHQAVFHYDYDERPFRPHLTLAFRDLTKENFYKAWDELGGMKIRAEFNVRDFSLLKHDGKQWQEHKSFKLQTKKSL